MIRARNKRKEKSVDRVVRWGRRVFRAASEGRHRSKCGRSPNRCAKPKAWSWSMWSISANPAAGCFGFIIDQARRDPARRLCGHQPAAERSAGCLSRTGSGLPPGGVFPGLERPLGKKEDFNRFKGKTAGITNDKAHRREKKLQRHPAWARRGKCPSSHERQHRLRSRCSR